MPSKQRPQETGKNGNAPCFRLHKFYFYEVAEQNKTRNNNKAAKWGDGHENINIGPVQKSAVSIQQKRGKGRERARERTMGNI